MSNLPTPAEVRGAMERRHVRPEDHDPLDVQFGAEGTYWYHAPLLCGADFDCLADVAWWALKYAVTYGCTCRMGGKWQGRHRAECPEVAARLYRAALAEAGEDVK